MKPKNCYKQVDNLLPVFLPHLLLRQNTINKRPARFYLVSFNTIDLIENTVLPVIPKQKLLTDNKPRPDAKKLTDTSKRSG